MWRLLFVTNRREKFFCREKLTAVAEALTGIFKLCEMNIWSGFIDYKAFTHVCVSGLALGFHLTFFAVLVFMTSILFCFCARLHLVKVVTRCIV